MPEDKILERIQKLFNLAQGEIPENASPAIQAAMRAEAMKALELGRELCLKYKVEQADLMPEQKVESFQPVFGYTIIQNTLKRFRQKTARREIWFEELAKVVAEGYFCKVGIRASQNEVVFYGLDLDREVAIFIFQKLAELANNLAKIEMKKAKDTVGLQGIDFSTGQIIEALPEWVGDDVFYESFHQGFREKVAENYLEQQNEQDEHSKEVFAKAREDVEEYFQQKADWNEKFPNNQNNGLNNYGNFEISVSHNEFAINIGKKVASRVTAPAAITNIAREQSLQIKKAVKNTFGEVYILIDTSGSMYGDKIEQAKSGTIDFAKSVSEKGHSVGVVVFNSGAKRIIEPMKKINGFFTEELSKIFIAGSTRMDLGIEIARSYFKTSRIERTLMIITDGEADDSKKALEAATEAKKSGIKIMAIGTDDADKEFLDKLCSMESIHVDSRLLSKGIADMARMLPAKT